jgi:hypothetical protein
MVLLLCLIFIGQSIASMSMFYSMASMQAMPEMSQTSSMNASHHQMTDMSHCDEEMTMEASNIVISTDDCCAQECDCLTSSCSTVSAFFAIINYTPDFSTTSKIISPASLRASQTLTSLYRPPILS